jgi:hypothetical protein
VTSAIVLIIYLGTSNNQTGVIVIMNCGDKSLKLPTLKDKLKTCVVIYYSQRIPPRYKIKKPF